MGLREIAEADLAAIVEDRQTGWGWDITLTSPDGIRFPPFVGFSTDISQAFDPETGALISGRTASVGLRVSSLMLAGLSEIPRAMPKTTDKPWVVQFNDLAGNLCTFKVADSRPDRTIGLIILILETYKV